MRILTWNLDHGCRGSRPVFDAQSHLIESVEADVVVLTEPPIEWSTSTADRVVSPAKRPAARGLEAWVGIVGPSVHRASIEIPFERMAAAAITQVGGVELVVYGSVLPWNGAIAQAPYLARAGESAGDLFQRILGEQVADFQLLRQKHPGSTVLWAGDFNQPLEGPNAGFSNQNRDAVEGALDALGLVAYNRRLAHAKDGCFAIDLICGAASLAATDLRRIDPVIDGEELSDHAAYVVDLM